ncbi:hypothetical protein ABW20_dc0100535 [Dactylellina cionopaga]|nr:hypothetical protein ABW20_dc0100535 [Dactylellina cionopaga]
MSTLNPPSKVSILSLPAELHIQIISYLPDDYFSQASVGATYPLWANIIRCDPSFRAARYDFGWGIAPQLHMLFDIEFCIAINNGVISKCRTSQIDGWLSWYQKFEPIGSMDVTFLIDDPLFSPSLKCRRCGSRRLPLIEQEAHETQSEMDHGSRPRDFSISKEVEEERIRFHITINEKRSLLVHGLSDTSIYSWHEILRLGPNATIRQWIEALWEEVKETLQSLEAKVDGYMEIDIALREERGSGWYIEAHIILQPTTKSR